MNEHINEIVVRLHKWREKKLKIFYRYLKTWYYAYGIYYRTFILDILKKTTFNQHTISTNQQHCVILIFYSWVEWAFPLLFDFLRLYVETTFWNYTIMVVLVWYHTYINHSTSKSPVSYNHNAWIYSVLRSATTFLLWGFQKSAHQSQAKKRENHRPIIFLYEDQISPTVYMSINSDVYWRIITYFSLRLFWLRLINLYVITHRWVFLPAADQKTFRIQCRHFRKTH